jgi:nascent polypeptide-associated complex subunit alpha
MEKHPTIFHSEEFYGEKYMNPAQLQKMMKQMGMEMEEVDAREVTIKCEDCDIKIKNPQVVIANIMGKRVYQISGNESVEKNESGPNPDDIKLVMEQTGHDKETVEKTLKDLNNDLARAIMELKKK